MKKFIVKRKEKKAMDLNGTHTFFKSKKESENWKCRWQWIKNFKKIACKIIINIKKWILKNWKVITVFWIENFFCCFKE